MVCAQIKFAEALVPLNYLTTGVSLNPTPHVSSPRPLPQGPLPGMSYPAPFPAPKVPLTVIFDSIPKFDGSTLGFDWLDTFNDVCEYFDLTPHWKIKNVERVLEGRAATWWAGRKLDFKSNLTQENSICKFALFSQLFTSYFNQAEIRSQAKLDLLKISYTLIENPSDYVNQNKLRHACPDRFLRSH